MSSLPLAEIRRRFFEGETLPDNSVPGPILHSWRRCLGLGLSAARLRLPDKLYLKKRAPAGDPPPNGPA